MRLTRTGLALIALGFTVVKTGLSQTVTTPQDIHLEMRPAPPPDWRGASVSADTARMRPGHLDFGRYDDPERCLRAVLHIQAHLYRHGELDTLRYTVEGDTLPTIAVDTGRACSARFHDTVVPVHQLGALIRLQLAVREDSLASATASRWLAMNLLSNERVEAWYTIASAYINASPIRLDAARAMIAKIDSMGPSMSVLQLRIRSELLRQIMRSFNTVEMRKESERILAIAAIAARNLGDGDDIEQKKKDVWTALGIALLAHSDVIAYEEGREKIGAFIDQIGNVVGDLVGDGEKERAMNGMLLREKILDQIVGKPFPDVAFDWTINGGANPQFPRAGRVTVVAFDPGPRWDGSPSRFPEFPNYMVLRRLADRYGSRGLDVVLVTQTRGFSVGSLVQTEEEELRSIEDLYLRYLKIPATIMVHKTSYNKVPDGRVFPVESPLLQRYGRSVLVVDQDGVIRFHVGGSAVQTEEQIHAYVESLLANEAIVRSGANGAK